MSDADISENASFSVPISASEIGYAPRQIQPPPKMRVPPVS